MLKKAFTVTTTLPPHDALGRLVQLLETEGVRVDRQGDEVRSSRTPIPVFNWDPRLYTRRNWVGINPFALVTAIRITATASNSVTVIDVSIDRRRMLLLLAVEAMVALSVALSAPLLPAAVVATVLLGACFVLLRWAHTLTRSEIRQQLFGVVAEASATK